MADKPDQKDLETQLFDARAQIATLTTERDALRADVLNGTSSPVSINAVVLAMRVERDTALAQVAALTTERDNLRTQVTTLTANAADFDGRVRAELTKFGIRQSAISMPNGSDHSKPNQGMNLTERALAMNAEKRRTESQTNK